jgi:glycosyltransferase involved in cell wall biosynthesis
MISVLIPVYNTKAEYFYECMDSVYRQTFNEYEILVIDNGSTQENKDKYLNYLSKKDKFLFLECERQQGKKNLSIALNYGISHSKYEFVARMDSDDIMRPDRLEKQIKYFSNENVDILGGQLCYLGTNTVTRHPQIITKDTPIFTDWFLNHPTVMFKKSKILEIGGYFDRPEYLAEDFELWTRALKNNLIIHNLQDIILDYRLEQGSLTFEDKKNKNYTHLLNYIRTCYYNHIKNGELK